MKKHMLQTEKALLKIRRKLNADKILREDVDFSLNFIPPYCKAENIPDIKLVLIG